MQAPAAKPTLLQKLLAPDIRAEHSRLLQALRFLRANDFLRGYGRDSLAFPPEPAAAAVTLPGTRGAHELRNC